MSKYFLGSVGKAEAFRINEAKELELAFVSKTLTDSGLNISTTKDDIRGGTGAPIQFSFYHDTNVEINLTDIQWKHEYLEAQLGAYMSDADKDRVDYVTRTLVAGDDEKGWDTGTIEIEDTILAMPIPCLSGDPYVVWYALQGDDVWKSKTFTAEDDKKITGLEDGKPYCVRFLAHDDRAVSTEITSLIVPQELFLIITAPLFAGDACGAGSKGKAAGHITFEVPRFQLNGAQEFSMNMSSNQTMSLAGIALASESIDCEQEGGKLLRIIEVIENRDAFSDVVALIIDEDCLVVGEVPVVYGEKSNGSLIKLYNSDMTFEYGEPAADALDSEGKFDANVAGQEVTFKFRDIEDKAIVAAA